MIVLEGDATHLISILRDASWIGRMTLKDWDSTVVLARRSRLLGVVSHRVLGNDKLAGQLPDKVVGHLVSAARFSKHRVQLIEQELAAVAASMPPDIPTAILKGAAYCKQNLDMAQGRLPSDLDLMVERKDLPCAEAALKEAGWESGVQDAYDQRYYREWSHEIPPMRRPGSPVEIDLHHTITPVTGRLAPNENVLFSDLRPLSSTGLKVLHPLDQVLHAVVHLFQDSELSGKLRDLVDIDGLIREHVLAARQWDALFERSAMHGFDRPLWYALRYCNRLFALDVPANDMALPSALEIRAMDLLLPSILLPRLPGRPGGPRMRLANLAGLVRYHWLRMPPALLAKHLFVKGVRRLRPS